MILSGTKNKFQNKIIIITGASRGIGAAAARALARRGARVAILSRTLKNLKKIKFQIQSELPHSKILPIRANIKSERDIRAAFSKIQKLWGSPDILINNAADVLVKNFTRMSLKEWNQILEVNLTGPFLCSREFAKSSRRGQILNISSLAGLRGTQKFRGLSAYTVSKFGVVGLTESLAVELSPKIRVNCLAPGAVQTEMLKRAAPHLKTKATPAYVAEIIIKMLQKSYTGRVLALYTNL